jgi:hypothetical protein
LRKSRRVIERPIPNARSVFSWLIFSSLPTAVGSMTCELEFRPS